jgi:hypothetical protein
MSQSNNIPLLEVVDELRTARDISHLAAISEVTDMLTTEKLPPAFALVDGGTLREIEPRGWWRGLGDYPRNSAFNLLIDGEPRIIPATEISLDRAAWQRALELIRATAAEQRAKAVEARAKAEYESPDWSLSNVLSWIAFRDPALIYRLDGLRDLKGQRRRYKGSDPPPFIEEKADAVLLAALQTDRLRAIKNGAEVESIYWYGKEVRNLSDNFRFRRSEVLNCWPSLSRAAGLAATEPDSQPTAERAVATSTPEIVADDEASPRCGRSEAREGPATPSNNDAPLKMASDPRINEAITAVYDGLSDGAKPPNVREVVPPVQAILRVDGYYASGRRITELAGGEKHNLRRRKPGRTVASEARGQ